jgi:hypothetical protein
MTITSVRVANMQVEKFFLILILLFYVDQLDV